MMSDNESSDCNDELQELIAEYEAKAQEKNGPAKQQASGLAGGAKRASAKDVEAPMDKVVFGDKKGLLRNLANAVGARDADETSEPEDVKEEAATAGSGDEQHESIVVVASDDNKRKSKKRKPAWVDADDEQIVVGQVKRATKHTGPLDHLRKDKTYKEYLTTRFTRIVSQPNWAKKQKKPAEENSDDEELLHTVGFLAKSTVGTLQQHNIQCKRLKDLNRSTVAQYTEGPLTSIQFHPTSTAALVAGTHGVATMYAIDGVKNEKLHSMLFRKFPIKCAKLMPCGTKAIFGSLYSYYYHYDLLAAKETRYKLPRTIRTNHNFQLSPCGRYMATADGVGSLFLLSAASNELIHTFRFGEVVSGMRFTANSDRIICNSRSSTVKIFSVRQQRLEHIFTDDGCISGRTLDLSPNQRMLATGSNEGVVNVYDFAKVLTTATPQPEKCFLNLTTAITDVKFNHTSELLAMCSKMVPNGTKLAHFPSATVFADYPVSSMKLGKVRLMEFSPNSGYLALGCLDKAIPLFRLKHYNNY